MLQGNKSLLFEGLNSRLRPGHGAEDMSCTVTRQELTGHTLLLRHCCENDAELQCGVNI